MSTNKHIAIIGAGLAGATLANKLMSAGCDVTLYEKSRGTGGRIASCRLGDSGADLGAPFLSPASDTFRQWLAQQPNIIEWLPNTYDFKGATGEVDATNKHNSPLFIATPRQSAFTRELITGASLHTSTRVGYLWPERNEEQLSYEEQDEKKQSQVLLRDVHGKRLGCYDAAIVTAPAKQAAPLLEAVPRFMRRAETATPTISWVLVLHISSTRPMPAELIEGQHPLLLRCIKDSAKPGRNNTTNSETWAVEATAEWSALHYDSNPEFVTEQLKSAFLSLLSCEFSNHPAVLAERVHRWLYSRHINKQLDQYANSDMKKSPGVNSGYLWDADTKIGACGDWLESGDIEGAWLSASKLAEHMIAQLNT